MEESPLVLGIILLLAKALGLHSRQVGTTGSRIHQALDCSPTNRERELGLD